MTSWKDKVQLQAQRNRQEIVKVEAGVSLTIPLGTHFQFRSTGKKPLQAIGVTMPPWPGEGEAFEVKGIWPPTVNRSFSFEG